MLRKPISLEKFKVQLRKHGSTTVRLLFRTKLGFTLNSKVEGTNSKQLLIPDTAFTESRN